MEDNRTSVEKGTVFGDVRIGGVFRTFGTSAYYMKIEETRAVVLNTSIGPMSTAGDIHKFRAEEEVVSGGWCGLSTIQTATFGF